MVFLCDIGSIEESLTDNRIDMFTRKGKYMLNIPLTSVACLQHIWRAVLQAGHVWVQTLLVQPDLEIKSPSWWDWQQDPDQKWVSLPQSTDVCLELTECGFKVVNG